jgi:flagellar biosynthesis protein FlhB
MAEGGDRTEQATPQRREESRRKGQVAVSTEVSPVLVLLTALTLGHYGAPIALAHCRLVLGGCLPRRVRPRPDDALAPFLLNAMVEMGGCSSRSASPPRSSSLHRHGGAGRLVANPELALPDLGRLSPAERAEAHLPPRGR